MSKKIFIGTDAGNSFAVIRANDKKEAMSIFKKEYYEKNGFKPSFPSVDEVNEYLDTDNIYLVFTQ